MIAQYSLTAIAGLVAVLGLVIAASRLAHFKLARSLPRTGRSLALRESIALDPRRRVHLVECGSRKVLLLTGGEQDIVIGWMQDP